MIIIIILKQYKPEFVVYVSLLAGAIILFMSVNSLGEIISLLKSLAGKTSSHMEFLKVLIKITGITILTEFAVSICKDSGESAIASKVDIGGKIAIVSMSLPIITSLLETIVNILP